MLQRKLVAIKSKTKCVSRVLDISTNNRLIDVCKAPVVDGNTAGRLASDDHPVWATAEVADVVVDPFDGEALIQ